jgi:DNA-binding response OmpR family regulator
VRALVADDRDDVRLALELLLKRAGHQGEGVASPREVKEALERSRYDVVLLDLNYTRDTTTGREGLELILDLQRQRPELPVVAMTAWGSVELAVEAMREGARDFVLKPWDDEKLLRRWSGTDARAAPPWTSTAPAACRPASARASCRPRARSRSRAPASRRAPWAATCTTCSSSAAATSGCSWATRSARASPGPS